MLEPVGRGDRGRELGLRQRRLRAERGGRRAEDADLGDGLDLRRSPVRGRRGSCAGKRAAEHGQDHDAAEHPVSIDGHCRGLNPR